MAGPFIDRIGKKPFIITPLFLSALLMVGYAFVKNAEQLFLLRITSGFVLAFISPAAFSLLSAYAKNSRQQGKNMAINGIMITMAGIAAPFIGGQLTKILSYDEIYIVVGIALFLTAIVALFRIREANEIIVVQKKAPVSLVTMLRSGSLLPIYFIGFALMYGHGTLFYELPFLSVEHGMSTAEMGKLFSLMGIGTFSTLSLFWLNRFLSIAQNGHRHVSFRAILLPACLLLPSDRPWAHFIRYWRLLGLLFPAITTLLTEKVGGERYGSAFGVLSAVFSFGIIVSSLLSGLVRDVISPYYLAFLVTIAATVYVVYDYLQKKQPSQSAINRKEAG